MKNIKLIKFIFFVLVPVFTLGCSMANAPPEADANLQFGLRNIAPLSNLAREIPGYVDGHLNPTGPGCGGGGGPCVSVSQNNQLTITFNREFLISKIVLFVGCNDQETITGEIIDLSEGNSHSFATFNSIGCGEVVSFNEISTNRIALLITGVSGGDQQISLQEVEVYGK